jgi:hypothetical protein
MQREMPHYRELDRTLAEEIDAVAGEGFSWGMNNKGFLAARRFYETVSRETHRFKEE